MRWEDEKHPFSKGSYIKIGTRGGWWVAKYPEEQQEEQPIIHVKNTLNRVPDTKYHPKEHPNIHEEHANSRRRTPKQAQLSWDKTRWKHHETQDKHHHYLPKSVDKHR